MRSRTAAFLLVVERNKFAVGEKRRIGLEALEQFGDTTLGVVASWIGAEQAIRRCVLCTNSRSPQS